MLRNTTWNTTLVRSECASQELSWKTIYSAAKPQASAQPVIRPPLTFNTADRPHPLPSPTGSHRKAPLVSTAARAPAEYCGEDSIPGSQVFSQSHRLSCRNTKMQSWPPCCRHNGCSRALPEPSEVAVISKTSTCVGPLSLWGTGGGSGARQGPWDPGTKSHKRRVVSATGEKLARQHVFWRGSYGIWGQYQGFLGITQFSSHNNLWARNYFLVMNEKQSEETSLQVTVKFMLVGWVGRVKRGILAEFMFSPTSPTSQLHRLASASSNTAVQIPFNSRT